MPSPVFEIKEHILECQHIREYARATSKSQEEVLHLAIKQYVPVDNPNPQPGDITIIGAHANGFPKELYEPLWEDLHARSKANGFRIRSIWIADVAQQGVSGVLNEELLGNDPSWMDHGRDLLHMINTFRSQMPMPIVGMGHSFGAAILCNVAFMHPRLLSTVVLMDPTIVTHASAPSGPSLVQSSTFRRDLWPSRAEAIAAFAKSKFYQSWDRRVFERWCQVGIRDTPTRVYPDEYGNATLSTTKHQECFTFMRPSWDGISPDGSIILRRDMVPDINMEQPKRYPLYRPEPLAVLRRLGELRPSVLYIFGETSPMSPPDLIHERMEITGNAPGGSGGVKEGRVKGVTLQGYGHLVAMEASELCADAAAAWLGQEVKRFEAERKAYEEWTKKSLPEKQTMSEEWKKRVGGPLKQPPKSRI
ncbi:Abhydrolase domain-containing protein mpaH [Lachnellula hyalina]|uniref:Abhydrolase domain-containing protein mpaH n=1 Tax=Lachnellula hyalina TaxID=1316788 RepID=A0A8H8R2M2_9HELO|nr:Abhydrolase domain-containing protein mpaH [Lachnellula hyalina]TVY27358.1 Abhydrolase domain-containing protein mpaH [Lachnellula hyalina]